jgi:hypothetical protein
MNRHKALELFDLQAGGRSSPVLRISAVLGKSSRRMSWPRSSGVHFEASGNGRAVGSGLEVFKPHGVLVQHLQTGKPFDDFGGIRSRDVALQNSAMAPAASTADRN